MTNEIVLKIEAVCASIQFQSLSFKNRSGGGGGVRWENLQTCIQLAHRIISFGFFYPQMERYQIQSAVRQLASTTSLMHGSPARRDECFYGDMIKDASVYLFPPLFHYVLDKSYAWLRYYLSNKCRGCRDTQFGLTAFKLRCRQSVLKVAFERQIGFVWIQRAFVCSWHKNREPAWHLWILYISIFFYLLFMDLWSFGAMHNMVVSQLRKQEISLQAK